MLPACHWARMVHRVIQADPPVRAMFHRLHRDALVGGRAAR
jgi:hypothetical protein